VDLKGIKQRLEELGVVLPEIEADYTQLSLFTMCPMKYWYIYRMGMEDKVGDAALFSSALLHPAISAWHLGEELKWDEWFKAFVESAKFPDMQIHTLEMAKLVYGTYVKQYASDRDEYEVVVSEVAASVPLDEDRWVSKPDVVLRRKSDGLIGVDDLKASGWQIGQELLPFDRQFLGQVKLVGAQWMRKTHVYLMKPLKTRPGPRCEITRSEHRVSEELLREWEQEIEMQMLWMKLCEVTGVWPKHSPGACTAFMKHCEFEKVCMAGKLRGKLVEGAEKVDARAYLKGGE
jgi:hypothetical protein